MRQVAVIFGLAVVALLTLGFLTAVDHQNGYASIFADDGWNAPASRLDTWLVARGGGNGGGGNGGGNGNGGGSGGGGGNGGNGPGDGTGNQTGGPADGTGFGPATGTCDGTGPLVPPTADGQ